MSQASCSSPISHSSLTRRISETTRAKSSSWVASAATSASTWAVDAAQHAGLAGAGERGGELVDVPHGQAQRGGDLVGGGTAPDPQLAVLAVAEELVGVARGPRPGVQRGLAVLDHQHGVAGLVAGEVGVRGVRPEPVVGVVGPDLVAAGGQHQPLAREGLGQRARRRAACSVIGCRGRSSSRSPQPVRMNCGPGVGHLRVVGLGLRLGRAASAGSARSRPSWYAGGGPRRRLPIGFGPCPGPVETASPSRSW